jgi:RHS repeat-associated protein
VKSVPGGDTAVTGGNFYHSDYLGSVPLITSKNDRGILPASIASRLFAPYGESYGNEGITGDVNFTGDNQDLVAGTFDTPNRELNSTQGRWISPDPAHASWNAYSYSTDPLVETDPSGLGPRIPWNVAPITGGMGGEGGGHVSDLSGPGTYIINGVSVSANAFYMQLEIGTGGFGGDFGTWTASGSGMSVASYDYGVVGYEQFGGAVCSDSCDGSGTPDEIAYPIYGLIGETFSDSGGDGGVLMATNNESFLGYLASRPWVVSWILPVVGPVPGVVGVGPAGGVAWNPQTHNLCVGFGLGASAGHNAAIGPLTTSSGNVDSILSGWSVSGGANLPFPSPTAGLGWQVIANSSGVAQGPTAGVAGLSGAVTWSACAKF